MKTRTLNLLPLLILIMLGAREVLTIIIESGALVSYYFLPIYSRTYSFFIVFDFLIFALKISMVVSLIFLLKLKRNQITNKHTMLAGLLLGSFILKTIINYVFVFEAFYIWSFLSVASFIAIVCYFILVLVAKPSKQPQRVTDTSVFQTHYPQPPVYQQPQHFQPPQPQAQQSMIAELAELERMHQAGVLTSAEFTAAKKRVLGS